MTFTAKDVQTLRERTGCGMMDCKKALNETNGDMEKAIDFLREKGLAKAAKKAGRIAAEGLIYVVSQGDASALIEVNSETDFVAKNDKFQEFVKNCAEIVLKENPADLAALMAMKYDETGSVEDAQRDKIVTIGENISVRRFIRYTGKISTYIHGGGRIGIMVDLDTDLPAETVADIGKDVAMQIAAYSPSYLKIEDVPQEDIEKEKEIFIAQALNEGKTKEVAEKMTTGRIAKWMKDICLLEQLFFKDEDLTIAQYIEKKAKDLNGAISIKRYVRFEKGEGIQKREDNFAEEVAGMIQ